MTSQKRMSVVAYIPTRGTPRLRAHKLAQSLGMDYRLVCDSDEQADYIARTFGTPRSKILSVGSCPGPPTGAAFKRHVVATQIAPVGRWMVWLDDNVTHLSGLPAGGDIPDKIDIAADSEGWRRRFSEVASSDVVWSHVVQCVERAESRGTINCGFATESNYFFRSRRWQDFGYCRSQFTLYKNDGSAWAPTPTMMWEDFYKTVDVVARYGSVVIDRHLKAEKPHFEVGGIGSLAFRLPHLAADCRYMMDKWPGLLSYLKGRDYQLTFAKRSFKTVNEWRKLNGYLEKSK